MFRILPTLGNGSYPILAQHGAFDSGYGWVSKSLLGLGSKNLILKLVDEGYDVWVSNARGTQYSNEYDRDVSLKERWNFSWAEMGTIDIPAIVDKMIEVTGRDKVTLMGYS